MGKSGSRFENESQITSARGLNRKIKHVVATTLAIDLSHNNGLYFLEEYLKFRSQWSFQRTMVEQ